MFKKRVVAKIEYGIFLPILGRIPKSIAVALCNARAFVNYLLKRDFWRVEILGDKALFERAKAGAMVALEGRQDKSFERKLFASIGLEELEASWLAARNIPREEVEYENFEAVERYINGGGKVVFLTAHYGSSILGIGLLGQKGLDILTMSSDFYMNLAHVPNSMKQFFNQKYAGLSTYLGRGAVIPQEGNLKRFYSFLKEGGHLMILGDLPASDKKSIIWVDFFGKKRAFSQGAVRIAEKEGCALVGFVCKRTDSGYKLCFGDVCLPKSKEGWYQEAYSFLEKQIKEEPWLYYGIDLIPLFAIEE